MKKTGSLILCLLLIFSLCACRAKTADTSSDVSGSLKAGKPVETEVKVKEPAESATEPVKEYVKVESMSLSCYEKTINIGENFMPIVTMLPKNAGNKAEIWKSDNKSVATVSAHGRVYAKGEGSCNITVTSADNNAVSAVFKCTVVKPKEIELTYIDGILIANKSYPLPSNYNPGVNPEAKAALDNMFAAAAAEGCSMRICSGFRSYSTQKSLYQKYVKRDGQAVADTYSARPGYSEHQTGFAFDINRASMSFEGTKEAVWLEQNAYKYGFIMRYPKGKESITGYQYEPWHYRYVGVQRAQKLFSSGLTIEEYYGITSVYAN